MKQRLVDKGDYKGRVFRRECYSKNINSRFKMDHVENKATSVVDHKFCLGGDVFLSVSFFRGVNNIHIRKWKSGPDDFNPGKTIVYPTKVGIMITHEQLKMLKNIIPHVISSLDDMEQPSNQRTQSTSASPSSSPCNNPNLMDPNFCTTTPASLPSELADIGFSQLVYAAEDREAETISVSSTENTQPSNYCGAGASSSSGGFGAVGESTKRPRGILSLKKDSSKKRKN